MKQKTIEQLSSEVEALTAVVAELREGLNYAVYGIGNPHPDPRGEAEAVPE